MTTVEIDRVRALEASGPVPRLRGVLHLITAPIALLGGLTLVVLAGTLAGRISVAIFTLTSAGLFTTSAVYHVGKWLPPVKAALRRADHSNIFLIIAGTYTPLSILLLNAHDAKVLLIVVWTGAFIGVLLRNLWLGAPRWLYVPIYIALGWAAVFYVPQFAEAGTVILTLIILGGVLYTVGALVYALKWPKLSERWFGFHELFHSFTIAAFLAHFAAVAITVATRT